VVRERRVEIDGEPIVWREAPGERVLYVHGVPTSSAIWVPFLERTGGIAVDLPGFGRSTKRGDFPFTIEGYTAFLDRFAEHVGLERFRLCVNDWGGLALHWAATRRARQVERLALIDAIPLLPGYRWHRIARAWRTKPVGEIAMGLSVKPALRRQLRRSLATPSSMPDEFVDTVARDLDQGTQRAILTLYRSADEADLAEAGAHLGQLEAPALIVNGAQDPYIPSGFADAYAAALGGPAEVLVLEDAGHWPWLDRPDLVETVARHLTR
jgi:pimeloyl-ACP methyl ester carboxylesterase